MRSNYKLLENGNRCFKSIS